jgi:pseudouridine synthase, RluA family
MAQKIGERHEAIRRVTTPLPGSQPYDHFKPLNVPAQCDGQPLLETLCHVVKHIPPETWEQRCAQGSVLNMERQPVSAAQVVRAGERFLHKFPAVIEPAVNMQIEILHEDEALIVLNKPAPLPMHAGGRFYRNTLQHVLDKVYYPQKPRPSHRLDANTAGVVVIARTRYFAGQIQPQFAEGQVGKIYLVRVQGHPEQDRFTCDAPIGKEPEKLGLRVVDKAMGLPARTEFQVVRRDADSTLLEARPLTGRTNQIRIHLWHLGWPVCGDPVYLRENRLGEVQTLGIQAPPLCLHAQAIKLTHPLTGKPVTFTAPPPAWAR